jgi:hypothetical protein
MAKKLRSSRAALLVVMILLVLSALFLPRPTRADFCWGYTNYYDPTWTYVIGQAGACCYDCDQYCSWGDTSGYLAHDYPNSCI